MNPRLSMTSHIPTLHGYRRPYAPVIPAFGAGATRLGIETL